MAPSRAVVERYTGPSRNIMESDMILFTAFATTFVLLIKAALAIFGIVAAVGLFLVVLVSLIWSAFEGARSSSAAQVARA